MSTACGARTPCVDEYGPTGRLAKEWLFLIARTSLAPDGSLVMLAEVATVGCIQTVQHLPVPVGSFTAFQPSPVNAQLSERERER